MPKITVLPNPKYCPEGAEFEMATGENLIRGLLSHGAKIEHACEMSCACSTCHVIIRKGFDSRSRLIKNTTASIRPGASALCPVSPAR